MPLPKLNKPERDLSITRDGKGRVRGNLEHFVELIDPGVPVVVSVQIGADAPQRVMNWTASAQPGKNPIFHLYGIVSDDCELSSLPQPEPEPLE